MVSKIDDNGFEVVIIQDYLNINHNVACLDKNYLNSDYTEFSNSEAVLILNYNGINIDNLILMSMAFAQHKDIFIVNQLSEQLYSEKIDNLNPIIINNNIQEIIKYYDSIPNVVLSSESPIKVKAVSLALREYNLRYRILGFKSVSGISEQPFSVQETYLGAKNRLQDLKNKSKDVSNPVLYISIESGNIKLLDGYNYIGLNVCIIDNGQKEVMSIATDLEIPKEMSDLVPSVYADLGLLVQDKYGVKSKDPFVFITNHKINRLRFATHTVYNTLALIL